MYEADVCCCRRYHSLSMAPVKSPESRNLQTAIPEGCVALLSGDTLSLTRELILQYCDKAKSYILNTAFGGGGSGVSTGLR